MTLHRLLITLIILALGVRVAAADDPALQTAKLHFDRGEKLYALTRFREALDEYQLAFDAKPLPELLFNIGQCYRNLGDYDGAVFSYRKYLQLEPDAANRAQVEQLIGELEAKRDQRDSERLGLRQPRPIEPPPPPAPRPFYGTWWFVTGVVVLGAAGGVTAYELTRSAGPPPTNLGNIVFGK